MHAKVHKNRRIIKITTRFYLRKNQFSGDFVFIDHRIYNIDQILTISSTLLYIKSLYDMGKQTFYSFCYFTSDFLKSIKTNTFSIVFL